MALVQTYRVVISSNWLVDLKVPVRSVVSNLSRTRKKYNVSTNFDISNQQERTHFGWNIP